MLLMMAPLAPHIAEELWERTGKPYSIHRRRWPDVGRRPGPRRRDHARRAGQRQGARPHLCARRHRGGRGEALALASEQVQKHLEGKEPRKVIYVPGKLVNIVV